MDTIPNSVCSKCKARNTLKVRLEELRGFERVAGADVEVWETLIVCARCGARTHASYTNAELEKVGAGLRAQRAKTLEEEQARQTAMLVFREQFDAFNREMVNAVVKRMHVRGVP